MIDSLIYVFQLPFKVDIIKHPCEVDGKSTAVHAAILAPHDVTVYRFPDIPVYTNLTKVSFATAYLISAAYPVLLSHIACKRMRMWHNIVARSVYVSVCVSTCVCWIRP